MENKYKVFFRRVSTAGQDLAMQESADAIYREKYLQNEIVIINEFAVSANKVRIADRPEMLKLINMIENNQVEIIFAFDRTRLFRDYYESNYFRNIYKEHNVRLFYTSAGNGHQQATDNPLVEGFLDIVGDMEGKNITRRNMEARRRYPPRKLGYTKEKETKRYLKDPTKQGNLTQYFSEIGEVTSYIELEEIIQRYKKVLGTTSDQLIKIVRDPFYAGYDLSKGKNKLNYVIPYLTLDQFQSLQTKNSIFTKYLDGIKRLKEQNIFQPHCGICQKLMCFRFNLMKGTSLYTCSKNHSKILIPADQLASIINSTLEKVIHHLDFDKLLHDTHQYFQTIRKPIEDELKSLTKNKNKIFEKIILDTNELQEWREHSQYKELSILETKHEQLLLEISAKQKLLLDNENVSELVKEHLTNGRQSNLFFLGSMLIQNLYVFENEVNIEINKSDYIQDIQKHYFFKGDEII